jgi:N-methylhydantoinase A
MLMSDLKHDFVRTYAVPLGLLDLSRLRKMFREMEDEGMRLLKSEHIPANRIEFIHSLDMRYLKQYHEVNVKATRGEIAKGQMKQVAGKFHPEHDRLYGYSLPESPIELINLRLQCIGRTDKPKLVADRFSGEDASKTLKGDRKVYLPGRRRFETVKVYDGDRLHFGNRIDGPAIVEQVNTSTFLTPEYSLICDRFGSYTLFLKDREDAVRKRLKA